MTTNSYIVPRVGVYSRSLVENIGFLFWFCISAKPMLALVFANDLATATLVGSLLDAVFFAILLASFATRFVLHRVPGPDFVWPTAAKLLFAFLAWAAITLLWTNSDSLVSAAGYWGLMALDVAVVFLLVRMSDIDVMSIRCLQGLVLGTTLLAVLAMVFLSQSGARLGDDDLLHPNALGNYVGIAALCSIYLVGEARRYTFARTFWKATTLVLLITLVRSGSKTALAAFALAAFVYFIRSRQPTGRKMLASLLLGVAIVAAYPVVMNRLYQTEAKSDVESLSGRTQLWADTWDMIRDNPIRGYGFFSFRNYGPQIFRDIRIVHAHDEWLNLWFTLGGVGVILALAIYWAYWRQVLRAGRRSRTAPQAALAMAVLAFALVRGITEASNGLVFPMTLMFVIVVWISDRRPLLYQN